MNTYKKPTLTQIKKSVLDAGGSYTKLDMRIAGQNAYKIENKDGGWKKLTKNQVVEQFMHGVLLDDDDAEAIHK